MRNVTITLPEDLVRAARHRAVDRGLSLSAYVASLIAKAASDDEAVAAARARVAENLKEGLGYDLPDGITWTRESLHRR